MLTATITSKGQVTIPKAIREALNLHPGDRLDFILENGKLYVQLADVDVRSLSGMLYKSGRQPVSLDQMEAAIAEGMSKSI
jgi:AbrB family looped-hinge helix DNA binding protein